MGSPQIGLPNCHAIVEDTPVSSHVIRIRKRKAVKFVVAVSVDDLHVAYPRTELDGTRLGSFEPTEGPALPMDAQELDQAPRRVSWGPPCECGDVAAL